MATDFASRPPSASRSRREPVGSTEEERVEPEDLSANLVASLADLDEAAALAAVRARVAAGHDPLSIIEECGMGLLEVGERYSRRLYYISGLIMAGEIFHEVVEILEPLLTKSTTDQTLGSVLLGTVQGDIHDMGKSIVHTLLRCHGFTVHDLGVDVPPSNFVASVEDLKPDIVGLSGLLTTAYESMRLTALALRAECRAGRPCPPIVIGGGLINEDVCRFVGADHWAPDAMSGVQICQRIARARPDANPAVR